MAVRIALLSYTAQSRQAFAKLLKSPELKDRFDLATGSLSNLTELSMDIAFAVFDADDNIDTFIADVGYLREAKHVQIVFALVTERAEELFTTNRDKIPTNHVLQLPMAEAEFNNAIMTGVVALKLKDEAPASRSNFDSQAKFLGDILVEHGIIDMLQLKKALDYQKGSDLRLGDALVMLNYITEEQKMLFVARQLGVDTPTPRQYASADVAVVALVPEYICRQGNCIALEKDGDTLVVAMEDVVDLQLLDNIRDITDLVIKPMLGRKEDISSSLDRYFRDITSQERASALVDNLSGEVEYVEQKPEDVDISEIADAGAELGVIKLVNVLIVNAVRDRASDIHFEPQENSLQIRYRIDGDLRSAMSPPKQLHQAIVARIKILARLDIAERRLPQDGRMVVRIRDSEVDIRVSILPSVHGEAAVLRILDKDAFEKSVANLGFNKAHLATFKTHITKPYGMIIVTGPTGSGKSTTLYSAIQQIKSVARNIITVEDPVEFHMEKVRQIQVNSAIGLTFANALRSILRQDPDIILIGEIRDQETADTAIKMSLTGHLVFSTLHTNDAVSTVSRFVDIGIPPLLLSSSLNLVIAQRLVRRICPDCKAEYSPDSELLAELGLDSLPVTKFYRGQGCLKCNGIGYRGRTGLFEMLHVSRDIRKMILRNAAPTDIQQQAVAEGMVTIRKSGIEKVLAGETTIEQVIAVSTEI